MTCEEVNTAITRLRRLNRASAGAQAYAYATQLLPVAANYATPADLAALWIITLALYDAALARVDAGHGVAALCKFVEDRYALLKDETPPADVFEGGLHYPDDLQNYFRALSQLPPSLVLCGLEAARAAVLGLSS